MLKKAFNKFIKTKKLSNQFKIPYRLGTSKALSCSILFVHIPKTAGTSFRKSAEILYPVISDYGEKSINTSDAVKKNYYSKQDLYSLLNLFNKKNQIFSGHFYSQKYLDFVDIRNIISFVRDPLEQVISHFNHHVSYLGYDGEFNDFIIKPRRCNIQSRYLDALPISLYGFIGLTANYEESLSFINQSYSLEIEVTKDNVGQQKIQHKKDLTPKQRDVIENYNSKDVILFNEVKALFAQRIAFKENDQPWVHGWGTINLKNILMGCAYYEKSDEVVQLELFINNKLADQFTANQFTDLYPKAKLPRARYIGFTINLNDFEHVTQVQLKVKETGQIIFEQVI